jgi:hypothetical protein
MSLHGWPLAVTVIDAFVPEFIPVSMFLRKVLSFFSRTKHYLYIIFLYLFPLQGLLSSYELDTEEAKNILWVFSGVVENAIAFLNGAGM